MKRTLIDMTLEELTKHLDAGGHRLKLDPERIRAVCRKLSDDEPSNGGGTSPARGERYYLRLSSDEPVALGATATICHEHAGDDLMLHRLAIVCPELWVVQSLAVDDVQLLTGAVPASMLSLPTRLQGVDATSKVGLYMMLLEGLRTGWREDMRQLEAELTKQLSELHNPSDGSMSLFQTFQLYLPTASKLRLRITHHRCADWPRLPPHMERLHFMALLEGFKVART